MENWLLDRFVICARNLIATFLAKFIGSVIKFNYISRAFKTKILFRNLDDWWYNNTKCSAPEDRGIVIRHNGTVDDLHSIQIPWSFDD
jgi:hypothetical protein